MEFPIVLFLATAVAWALPARYGGRSLRDAMRRGFGVAFMFAGVAHFLMPEAFGINVPAALPFPEAIIALSGALEIVGGLALILGRYQERLGVLVAIYLLAVFPGNVNEALFGTPPVLFGSINAWWYPWLRLPLQAVLIWWVLYSTNWPPLTPQRRLESLDPATSN
jgi:uncharacterized membrane protein